MGSDRRRHGSRMEACAGHCLRAHIGRAPRPYPLERVMGIEPTPSAWKAEVLPLNYTRNAPAALRIRACAAQRSTTFARPSTGGVEPPLTAGESVWWRGEDSNLRRLSRQIYSLIPLTAREPLQATERASIGTGAALVNSVPPSRALPCANVTARWLGLSRASRQTPHTQAETGSARRINEGNGRRPSDRLTRSHAGVPDARGSHRA